MRSRVAEGLPPRRADAVQRNRRLRRTVLVAGRPLARRRVGPAL